LGKGKGEIIVRSKVTVAYGIGWVPRGLVGRGKEGGRKSGRSTELETKGGKAYD